MPQTVDTAPPANPSASRHAGDGASSPPITNQVSKIFGSLWRVTKLELNILVANTKLALMRVVMFTIFAVIASLFAIAGIVILDISIYHVLTDVLKLPTLYALLAFAGLHFLFAAIVFGLAFHALHKRRSKTKKKEK